MKTGTYFKYLIVNILRSSALAVILLPVYSATAQSDTTKKLNQVTISSSRAELLKSIVPAQQLNSSQFIRYSAFTVADALRGFSGVNVKDYGGVGGLKTVSVRGLGANHTAVLFDGIQINDAENGQIDLGKFNLNNVQSITLYNGQPTDLLMPARSFATASVIAINTTRPTLSEEKPYQVTAGIRGGSFGLINPYLQWQQRLSDKWAFVVNGYTQNAHGRYKYFVNDGSKNLAQERIGAAVSMQQVDGALYFNGADSSKFNIRVNYYHADRGLPGAAILYVAPQQGQRLWNNDFFTQAGYQKSWVSGLRLMVNAKYANNYLHYFDPTGPYSKVFLDQHYRQQEYYQSASLAYMIADNWEVSYSADVAINSVTSNLVSFKYPTRTTLLNVLASNFRAGRLTLQGSLLNSNINESVEKGTTIPHRNVFSPTLVASYKVSEPFMLRAFYKNTFRAPTFNELYYTPITNRNIRPEFAAQYDLGAVYNRTLNGPFEYITLTTDVYYNRVTDKIIFTPDVFNGSVTNIRKVEGIGADLGLRTESNLGNNYKGIIAINYSFQRAMNVSSPGELIYKNQLPYTPYHLVNVNVGVNKQAWGLYYNHLFSSVRFYNNNNNLYGDEYLPAYGLADVSVIYKGKYKSLPVILSAELNNLYNQNYVVVRGYPMPGRSLRISFQITI